MADVKDFVSWFLEQLPSFLLAQPIASLMGFAFLAYIIKLFKDIISI